MGSIGGLAGEGYVGICAVSVDLCSEGLVVEVVDDGGGAPGEEEAGHHQRARPHGGQGRCHHTQTNTHTLTHSHTPRTVHTQQLKMLLGGFSSSGCGGFTLYNLSIQIKKERFI